MMMVLQKNYNHKISEHVGQRDLEHFRKEV